MFVFRLLGIRVTVFFATYLLILIYSSALLKQCSGAIVRFSDSSSFFFCFFFPFPFDVKGSICKAFVSLSGYFHLNIFYYS